MNNKLFFALIGIFWVLPATLLGIAIWQGWLDAGAGKRDAALAAAKVDRSRMLAVELQHRIRKARRLDPTNASLVLEGSQINAIHPEFKDMGLASLLIHLGYVSPKLAFRLNLRAEHWEDLSFAAKREVSEIRPICDSIESIIRPLLD